MDALDPMDLIVVSCISLIMALVVVLAHRTCHEDRTRITTRDPVGYYAHIVVPSSSCLFCCYWFSLNYVAFPVLLVFFISLFAKYLAKHSNLRDVFTVVQEERTKDYNFFFPCDRTVYDPVVYTNFIYLVIGYVL